MYHFSTWFAFHEYKIIKPENPLTVVLYKQCCSVVLALPAMQETPVRFLWGEDPWRRDSLPTPVYLGLPGGWDGKESICNVGDLGSIPRLERSPGGGDSNPLQYSCLENPHGQRSLDRLQAIGSQSESDTTEWLSTGQQEKSTHRKNKCSNDKYGHKNFFFFC